MSSPDDMHYMRLAIDASQTALAAGNTPFGAALVRDGVLLHVAGNTQVTSGDCTAHAEMVLLREAMAVHGRDALRGSTVYASGEPCAMCAGAIFWAGVARVVFAAPTVDINQALGAPVLIARCEDVMAGASHKVSVEGPLLRAEAVHVLQQFARSTG
jgi:tRNA(Arg) A34 adenosine deaminase TadA